MLTHSPASVLSCATPGRAAVFRRARPSIQQFPVTPDPRLSFAVPAMLVPPTEAWSRMEPSARAELLSAWESFYVIVGSFRAGRVDGPPIRRDRLGGGYARSTSVGATASSTLGTPDGRPLLPLPLRVGVIVRAVAECDARHRSVARLRDRRLLYTLIVPGGPGARRGINR